MRKVGRFFNTLVYALSFIVLVVTFSIAIPILWRDFYFFHIDLLNITEATGYSKSDLIMSFNELMDSLVFYQPFGEGVFHYSESGMNHFLDCRVLFTLDLVALPFSFVIFLVYSILIKLNFIKVYRIKGMSILFYASFVPILLLGALGVFALIDVNSAYAFFHAILFPGKDNWIFNQYTDPIINALPEQFFLDCGILIFGVMLLILLAVIIFNIVRKVKHGSIIKYSKQDLKRRGVN